jgi:serine/threonine protein kinase
MNRLERVALGLVQGMKYVVLRDLKPDNIGFSKDGEVKLFDSGFAREVHACDFNEFAGSLCYVASEYAWKPIRTCCRCLLVWSDTLGTLYTRDGVCQPRISRRGYIHAEGSHGERATLFAFHPI